MGSPVGLDFMAVLATASAQGADTELIADALPGVENAMLAGMSGDGDLGGEDE